ncbi:MAG: 2-dehydro-3-deoxygalactonokinase [Planctomycetota bacterium]
MLDKVDSPEGIMHVPGRDFETVFGRLIAAWPTGKSLPVLASGMITSRNGWVETPYVNVPLGAGDLARTLVPHRTSCGIDLRFITGVTTDHPSGPDVMRGEETPGSAGRERHRRRSRPARA